jgi:PAS domain S-box-containing protein
MSDTLEPSPHLHGEPPEAATAQAMLDHKELSAAAFQRTRMPMVVTDPRQADHPIVMANPAFLTLTGYSAEEVLGRNCRLLQGSETSAAAVAEIRAAIAQEREATVELLNYRKDGAAFWNELHISPIHDKEGRLLYYFGSQVDVSDYRKVQSLEATEHRLLMEVEHRARNVLAVVNGIVRLSRADTASLYATAVQQRIQALATAHTLLAEGGWREVSLEALVRQQLLHFGPERIIVEGPRVLLSAGLVQPLALVLHELLANATTHGALSSPAGRLAIRWSERGGDGFELSWEETSGPTPSLTPQAGFGTAMMAGMIERQLRGSVRREWRHDGLVVNLAVPGSQGA